MSFEDVISNGIPLHEAARFFLDLKKMANQPTEPPDETGLLEGKFAVPIEQVLMAMGTQVQNEFETHMSYKVYAQTLRDLSHFAISEHFEDHAAEEMDHADFLLRRMSALGGPAHIPDVQAPPASADPIDIIKRMIRMEQEAIMNWRNLRQMVGDSNPTSIAIDDYMLKEQEHIDDLWLLLPHTERAALIDESKQLPMEAPQPQVEQAVPSAQAVQPPVEQNKAAADMRFKVAFAMLKQAAGMPFHDVQEMIQQGVVPAAKSKGLLARAGQLFRGNRVGALEQQLVHAPSVRKELAEGMDIMTHPELKNIEEQGAAWLQQYGHTYPEHAEKYIADANRAQQAIMARDIHAPLYENVISPLQHEIRSEKLKSLGVRGAAATGLVGGGAGLGAAGGTVLAHRMQQPAAQSAPEVPFQMKAAMARMIKMANELLESAGAQEGSPITPAPPVDAMGSPGAPDAHIDQFLSQEQMMQQAQDTNEANFYRQKFQEAQQQLQQSMQAAQSQQQQMDQMSQQLQGMQGQIDGALQQGQQIQQTAMTNAQSAQAAATQAMQQTLAANSELINQQQLSSNMRNAYQQLQQQIQQVTQTAPPPATTMEAGAVQTPPAMAGGAPGGPPGAPEQAGQEPGPGPEATGAGQPGGEATPTAGPAGGPTPGGQGAESGAQGSAAPQPTADRMGPQSDQTPPQPEAAQVSKQASDLEKYLMVDGEKYASFLADAQLGARGIMKEHAPELIGAGAGAVGGGLLPFGLKGGEEQLAALRQHIADNEARKDELGWRDELKHITDKTQLGMEEFAQKHPIASHAVGALTGAGVGAGVGTAINSEIAKRQLAPGGY